MNAKCEPAREALWTKEYIAMILLTFFLSVSLNMTGTVTPLFATHLGGDLSTLGLVMAFFTAAAMIFRPYFGNMIDKRGRKLTIISGGIVFSAATLAYGATFSVIGLLVLRFLHGFGFSAHSTAAGTVVADIVPSSRLTEGVGFFGISHTLAMALGPVIGLNLLEYLGFNAIFVLAAILAVISVGIAFGIQFQTTGKPENVVSHEQQNNPDKKSAFIELTAIPASFVLLFIALTLGAIFTFLPAYAASRNIGDIGIFFTAFALIQLAARPLTGKLADKYGFSSVIIPGLAFMAFAMILLAFATNLVLFITAGLAYGIGFGSVQPTLNAIMIKLCPSERRGVGNATFFSAMDIGIGTGAIIWGIISQIAGFTFVFIGSALCIVAASILYVFWLSKQLYVNDIKKALPPESLSIIS